MSEPLATILKELGAPEEVASVLESAVEVFAVLSRADATPISDEEETVVLPRGTAQKAYDGIHRMGELFFAEMERRGVSMEAILDMPLRTRGVKFRPRRSKPVKRRKRG